MISPTLAISPTPGYDSNTAWVRIYNKKSRLDRDSDYEHQGLLFYFQLFTSLIYLDHGTNTFCTDYLARFASIFINSDLLKIGLESTSSSLFGPGTIATKSRFLPAILTSCHLSRAFLDNFWFLEAANKELKLHQRYADLRALLSIKKIDAHPCVSRAILPQIVSPNKLSC